MVVSTRLSSGSSRGITGADHCLQASLITLLFPYYIHTFSLIMVLFLQSSAGLVLIKSIYVTLFDSTGPYMCIWTLK